MLRLHLLWLTCIFAACGQSAPTISVPPSKVEPIGHESALLRLTLSSESQQRLGIKTARVEEGGAVASRHTAGEIVVPPIGNGGIPTGSLANLQQIGAQQVAADGEVARAAAQAHLAQIALDRAKGLIDEEAGSARARDEAVASLAAANAALVAAREQRVLLGPPIASMNTQSAVWVRVSVFGSDLEKVSRADPAEIRELGEGGTPREARPVNGPPSANAVTGTVDLFYALSNADHAFRVGQRVAVELPLSGAKRGLIIPSDAIVRDIYGGEWAYERVSAESYVRQRIETASEQDGESLLARGLRPGAEIVTAGAAELFGIEFGAAH